MVHIFQTPCIVIIRTGFVDRSLNFRGLLISSLRGAKNVPAPLWLAALVLDAFTPRKVVYRCNSRYSRLVYSNSDSRTVVPCFIQLVSLLYLFYIGAIKTILVLAVVTLRSCETLYLLFMVDCRKKKKKNAYVWLTRRLDSKHFVLEW